jgi:hypothetical protein
LHARFHGFLLKENGFNENVIIVHTSLHAFANRLSLFVHSFCHFFPSQKKKKSLSPFTDSLCHVTVRAPLNGTTNGRDNVHNIR